MQEERPKAKGKAGEDKEEKGKDNNDDDNDYNNVNKDDHLLAWSSLQLDLSSPGEEMTVLENLGRVHPVAQDK